MGFGLQADIELGIGELKNEIRAVREELVAQVYRVHPARQITSLQPVATFSNPSQIQSVGNPPGGMQWAVRRISFGLNAGGTVTTAGTMIVFIGAVEIFRTTTVPNMATFSDYECLVTPNDDLGVVWAGGALGANSAMVVDVAAAEYPILGSIHTVA